MLGDNEEDIVENVFDFVYFVPVNNNDYLYKFETRAYQLIGLGISVNTDSSSSGI